MKLTYYDKIGDRQIKQLIRDFYREVRNDELLSPMYKGDFAAAEERLYLFMVQYLGGPDHYNRLRGHPRLRMRHMVFPINEEAKANWLSNMKKALDRSAMEESDKAYLWNYFRQTADFLKNR